MWSITSATRAEIGACEPTHGHAAEAALALGWARVVAAAADGGPASASATASAHAAAASRTKNSRDVDDDREEHAWNIPTLPASERSPAGRCIGAVTHGDGGANPHLS